MKRTEQIRTIRNAYLDLPDIQDGYKTVKRYLLDMNVDAERQHRRGTPNGITHGLTVKDAGKLFTCSHLLDGWKNPERFSVNNITHLRTEVFYAQAYAKQFHAELADWYARWSGPFAQVDYVELMKVGGQ